MHDIISLLPDSVANQIAAGEVVQRPASVVKELLENAIDASATHIKLIIKDAGKTLIQVIDDGIGMSPIDARMSFERHATSKIKKAEDLFKLHTKGFRGEALASIAAVAQVELKTKRATDKVGQLLEIEGNKPIKQEETNCAQGSSFSVKNLFFNIPARRNFLKEENTELKHIIDEFERVALAHNNIHFQLYNNNVEMFNLPAGTLIQRCIGLFGNTLKDKIVPINETTDVVKISGYIGKPEIAKKRRGDQYFFVNNRFIKSPYLNHAVYEAYKQLISNDTNPVFYLFLEVEPHTIDINIHPTKTEIKFQDEKVIYALLHSVVKRSLGKANLGPSLDFNSEMSFEIQPISPNKQVTAPSISVNTSYNPFSTPNKNYSKPLESTTQKHNKENWEKLFESHQKEVNSEIQTSNVDNNNDALLKEATVFNAFQVYNKYIITNHENGVLVIDQQRAHERILYEHYLQTKEEHPIGSQQVLFPTTLELSPNDFVLLEKLIPQFKLLGFDIEPFGKSTVVVNGTPVELNQTNTNEIIEGILETYKLNIIDTKLDVFENMCRSMAKSTCIKYGKTLEQEEMQILISHLFNCENPTYTPSGKAIIMEVERNDIEKFFKR